jgi:hypothetical protein
MNKLIYTILIITLLQGNIKNLWSQASDQTSSPSSTISPRIFQVSFIPYFGTNGLNSENYINNISFNILAGYNGGTSGFELGGLVNIDRYEVSATQIAGIGNHGGQLTTGAQIAGIYNIAKVMKGTQIAGITNITSSIHGVQIAGISNHTIKGNSAQIGGLVNVTEENAIFQLGGLSNHARSCKGTQIAGLVNTARETTGSQISGIVNIARTVRGSQIGFINIADTCKGVPIGVINIIKNGYQRFELSTNEFFQANFSYRSGVEKFHTILSVGIQPGNLGAPLWTYGTGLGTSQALSPKMLIDFDASFNHILKKGDAGNNYHYKIYLGLDRSLSNHLSLAFGLSYNFLTTDIRDPEYGKYYADIAPYSFSNQTYNRTNLKSWAGAKIGLRFR